MFDMKRLGKLRNLDANAADAMKAFWAFDKAVFADEALSGREKQLIAVAVAPITRGDARRWRGHPCVASVR